MIITSAGINGTEEARGAVKVGVKSVILRGWRCVSARLCACMCAFEYFVCECVHFVFVCVLLLLFVCVCVCI